MSIINRVAIQIASSLSETKRQSSTSEQSLKVALEKTLAELQSEFASGKIVALINRAGSRELDTHYKWLLIDSTDFSLWIHEYKKPGVLGRARTIHNHRYSFASTVLRGSLSQRTFTVEASEGRLKTVSLLDEWTSLPEMPYSLNASTVHQVTNWTPATATLVLKGSVQRMESDVIDLETFTMRRVGSVTDIAPLALRR